MGGLCSNSNSQSTVVDTEVSSACRRSASDVAAKPKDCESLDYSSDGKQLPLPGVLTLDSDKLSNFTDLQSDLKLLRKRFGHYLYADLLEQKWQSIASLKTDASTSVPSFRVLQFNALADGLCTGYSMLSTDKTFVGVSKSCLRWTYRGLRQVELVCAKLRPDLVFMQEIDKADFWMQWLQAFGYTAIHQAKDKSPTRHCAKQLKKEFPELVPDSFEYEADGVLIAWRNDAFSGELSSVQRLTDGSNEHKCIGLAVELTHTASQLSFLAMTSHLKSAKNRSGEELRLNQVKAMFGAGTDASAECKDFDEETETGLFKNDKKLPVIFGCDLNANPCVSRHGYAPLAYDWLATEGFLSAYRRALGAEPPVTTAKKRSNGVYRHTIDYVFTKALPRSVAIGGYLHIPRIGDDDSGLIPDWNYPSDHFAIGVQFVVGKEDEEEESDGKEDDSAKLRLDAMDGSSFPPLPGVSALGDEVTHKLGSDLFALRCRIGGEPLPTLLRQQWHCVAPKVGATKSSAAFSMIQWNAMADALSTGYHTFESSTTAEDFVGVDKACLRWTYRGLRVMEHLLSLSPDVVCLEEVDFFEDLQKYVADFDYECHFLAKDSSATERVAKRLEDERGYEVCVEKDGVCILLKRSVFRTLEVVNVRQTDCSSKAFALFVKVQHIDSGKQFAIGATQLKSGKTKSAEKIRVAQMTQLLAAKYMSAFSLDLPLFLGCDMNATPTEDGDYEPQCFEACAHELGLSSAYKKQPLYTTVTKRERGTEQRAVDYIWTQNEDEVSATVTHVLSIPELDPTVSFTKKIEESTDFAIPNWNYPSHHFAIGAVFDLAD